MGPFGRIRVPPTVGHVGPSQHRGGAGGASRRADADGPTPRDVSRSFGREEDLASMTRRMTRAAVASLGAATLLVASLGGTFAQSPSAAPAGTPYPDPVEQPPAPT